MRASSPSLCLATALGLLLSLPALPAHAEPGGWVDPPKAAAKAPAAATPTPPAVAAPAPMAPAPVPTKAASSPVPAEGTRALRRAEGRDRIAATPRRHATRQRRLAETPAVAHAAPSAAAAPAGRVEAAQALATEYLSVVSGSGEEMVGATPRFYGARVRFYGRATTMAALLDEKRGFVRRWPERRYAARAFSTQCSPDGASCIVRAIVDFRAANPQRGAVSRGASELVLEVSFVGQRPVIVAESGRVLHRDARGLDRAETLAPSPRRG